MDVQELQFESLLQLSSQTFVGSRWVLVLRTSETI